MNKVILIGGEERPVNFGRNFWGEVEQRTGKTLPELLSNSSRELMSWRNGTIIAYCALKWGLYDPSTGREPSTKFTEFQVGDWIEANNDIMVKFYEELTGALPTKKKDEVEVS